MTTRKYLYEAHGKSGHIDADSVDDARRRLAGAGYADAVVHDDDFLSDLREADEKLTGIKRPADLEALLRHDASALGLTLYVLRNNWLTVAVLGAVVALLAASGAVWWVWTIVLAIAACAAYALLFPGWLQWQQNEMHRRFWAGEWDACEAIARRLRGLRVVENLHSVQLELDSRIAGCLLMRGDVEAGYAFLAPWENFPGLAQGTYLVKLNMLHFLARDWRRFLEVQERILAETGLDTAAIDLALMLARAGDDDTRATALLDSLDARRTVPMQIGFIAWARGVLLLKRGDDEAGLRELAVAIGELQKLAAVNLWACGVVALAAGYLAVAMARTGRRETARETLASVGSIVARHGDDLLLGWLRAEKLQA